MTSFAEDAGQRPSVVCGLDHSDHAPVVAETATVLAERLGLRLVFVHAVPARVPPLAPVWIHHDPEDRGEIRRRAIDRGWLHVEQFVESSGLADVVGRVERGLPADCLHRLADEEAAEYIVLGTRGEGGARALMGSVALATIKAEVCPLVVVPPSSSGLAAALRRARYVLCGIGARGDRAPVRAASRLAGAFHLSLLPAHVADHADDAARSAASARTDELLADVLANVLASSPPGNATAFVPHGSGALAAVEDPATRAGDPAEQLVLLAAEAHAALVVVGTRGRGPLRGARLGSVSRSVACRSGVPVVICPRATAD